MEVRDEVAEKIIGFLRTIGLGVRITTIEAETFLPGVCLEPGGLAVDLCKLRYPGDLLHEAGHLAVMVPEQRATTGAHAGEDMGDEIGAQCWSYAAGVYLGLDAAVVFHDAGYKSSAATLRSVYANGNAGVPLLQWMGLTLDTKRAADAGEKPYPHMQRWLRGEKAEQQI